MSFGCYENGIYAFDSLQLKFVGQSYPSHSIDLYSDVLFETHFHDDSSFSLESIGAKNAEK